jgi:hypothetical protein
MMAHPLRTTGPMKWVALSLLWLLPLPGAADELVRAVDARGHERLRIALEVGNVEVVAWDGDRVRLEARAHGVGAGGVRFLLREDDAGLVLESRREAWLEWLSAGPRVLVRAWVPRRLRLDVETRGRIVTRDAGVARSFPARSAPVSLAAP